MLENASQAIACNFGASQVSWNVPSWECSIAPCGWAYRSINLHSISPGHTLRCCTPSVVGSKGAAMYQNCMQCSAFIRPSHMLRCCTPTIGPATRCDENGYFPAILKHLEPSQPIAEHRRYKAWPHDAMKWGILLRF